MGRFNRTSSVSRIRKASLEERGPVSLWILEVCRDRSGNRLVVAGAAIEDEGRSAGARIDVGRDLGASSQIGSACIAIASYDSIAPLALPKDGVAGQPVILDRPIGGRIDHPSDQIAARAGGRGSQIISRECRDLRG